MYPYTIASYKEHLDKLGEPDAPIVASVFTLDDIKDRATEMCGPEQAERFDYEKVMEYIQRNFDASQGINWDVIDDALEWAKKWA